MEIESNNNIPFFIVGVQRSGTTLLRLLLNAHSEIAIPEEASFLKPILKRSWVNREIRGEKKQKLVSYLRENEQFQLWNFDKKDILNAISEKNSITVKELMEIIYSSYAQHEQKKKWGDKSLFFGSMELLYDLFPKAKFIHIVRDGRDVFYSWRKMDPSKSHPAVMALDWKIKHRLVERSLRKIPKDKIHLIRYEDLVQKPEFHLKQICEFLKIDFEQSMIDFHLSSNKYIGKHHSELIFKAIDNKNTDKWKRKLTKKEQLIYQAMAGHSLIDYNYDLIKNDRKLLTFIWTGVDLTIGLPKRLIELIKVRIAFWRALRKGEATKTIKVGEMPEHNN